MIPNFSFSGNRGSFSDNIDNQMKDLEIMMRTKSPQQIQQVQQTPIDDVSRVVSGLSQQEQMMLSENEEFIQAKSIFDRAFLDYLQDKCKIEFAQTQYGQQVSQNLLDKTNLAVSSIREKGREELERINRLSKLLEQNPDLLSKLESENGRKD